MPRILFDTNALIDCVVSTRPQHGPVRSLVAQVARHGDVPLALASSLKDAYYICTRHYGDEATARDAVRMLRRAFELVDLDDAVVDAALESDEPDFEDGLVRAAAEASGCALIVSRDARAFQLSKCRRLSPAEALLELYG